MIFVPRQLIPASLCWVLASGLLAQDRKVAATNQATPDVKAAAPSDPPTSAKTYARAAAANFDARPAPASRRAAAPPAGQPVAPSLPTDRALFGGGGSGEICAVGSNFKVSITAQSFTYVPYFGAEAPQNYPVETTLTELRLGDTVAPLAAPTLRQAERSVYVARGPLTERYDVAVDRVEQCFVIDTPFQGDLCLRLRVSTPLDARQDDTGLRFSNALGTVTCSAAVLVDAAGRRLPMHTALADGILTLRADAATVARASFPITVDPVYATTVAANNSPHRYFFPDIAYAYQSQNHLVVWTRDYSATDRDVYAVAITNAGQNVANSFTVLDGSLSSWDGARVAVCNDNFLMVASRLPAGGGQREIWGITRSVYGPTTGAQFQISGGDLGDNVAPDVGGEFDLPAHFCVVWQRNFSATDHDIHYRLVTAAGAVAAPVVYLSNSSADDYAPAIAKSSGSTPTMQQAWPVTWQRLVGAQHDIYGAKVRYDGTIAIPPFAIDTAPTDNDTQPCPSSITDDINGQRYWMVAYTTDAAGDADIYFRIFREPTSGSINSGFLGDVERLTTLVRLRDQSRPQVDTDGCRFAVGYIEAATSTDHNALVSTLQPSAVNLALIEARAAFNNSTLQTLWMALCAERSGGGDSLDYGVAWELNGNSGPINTTIEAGLYQGFMPGGGLTTRATACGGVTLNYANEIPGPGRTLRFDVVGGGPSLLVVGVPSNLPLCSPNACTLGATLDIVLAGPRLDLAVPCWPGLVGATIAVQGAALSAPGGCANLSQLGVSGTVDVRFQ